MSIYSSYTNNVADLIGLNSFDEQRVYSLVDTFLQAIPGEIRFQTSLPDIKENGLSLDQNGVYTVIDSEFDGWVYPDGKSRFYCSQFPEISSEYAVNESATTFIVPELTTYFKMSNESTCDYTEKEPQKSALYPHRHRLMPENKVYDSDTKTYIDKQKNKIEYLRINNDFKLSVHVDFGLYFATEKYDASSDVKDSKGYIIGSEAKPFDANLSIHLNPPNGMLNSIPIKTPYIRRCPNNQVGQQSYVLQNGINLNKKNNIYSKFFMYDKELQYTGVENPKFVPSSIRMPVMIYLGRPNIENI